MTDMIAAEPHLARRLLARMADPDSPAGRLADAVRAARADGRPVIATGCGTSEHGALGIVEILRDALDVGREAVLAEQAYELALDPPADALLIGVSHEGGTAATNRAIAAARAAGSRTALVTAAAGSPGAALADLVVATDELDQSWCHTVGYVSPLLAATAVAAQLTGQRLDAEAVGRLMDASASAASAPAEAIAAAFSDAAQLLVIGSGADRTAGRELVLKVEEAAWLASAYRDLESFLHGHLPATGEATGLVLLLTDPRARDERAKRARQALAAARALGVRSAAIVTDSAAAALDPSLTPAGRIVVPDAPSLPAPVASLLASAMALQVVTERIARARGTNPDAIRRDDPRYRAASDAADG